MAHLLVHHHVDDYGKWKPFFDEHASERQRAGSKGERLFRSSKDPNEIFVIMEWDSMENAQKFTQSDSLKGAMKKGGVQGIPEAHFLEEISKSSS